MDVTLLRWPDEERRRSQLAEAGHARLLLVDHDVPAPVSRDPLEDWIRLPADDADLRARVDGLSFRTDHLTQGNGTRRRREGPTLDVDGLLRMGGSWVALAPIEALLVGALLERPGTVVSREALIRAAWPDVEDLNRNVLDVHMLRLRRRIEPLDVIISTVRSRGYLLSVDAPTNHDG